MGDVLTGKVKKFGNKRGYGFITLDDGRDAFIHYSDIVTKEPNGGFRTLYKDEPVEFEVVPGNKEGQLKAINVVVLEESEKRLIERKRIRAKKEATSAN